MDQEWEVRDSKNFGKGLFATKNIEKWSKLVQLESEVNVLDDCAVKNHCSKCLKHSETDLFACPKCNVMKYCSNSCLDSDAVYHLHECFWFHKVISELTPETENVCLPSRSQRFLMRFVSHLERMNGCHFDLIDNCSLADQGILDEWRNEAVEIKNMVPAIKCDIEELIKFAGILKSNSYMMRKKESGEGFGGQLIEVHSRINHSCDPNCVSSFDGTSVFLISLRKIEAGEEITVSYTETCKPRKDRQEHLKNNLFFDCKCSLCILNEFQEPEALRTATICECGQFMLNPFEKCSSCQSKTRIYSSEELNGIVDNFSSSTTSTEKLEIFKDCKKRFHECHWINNKLADLMIKEYCNQPEYTRALPELLVDFKTGLVKGYQTISNPFVLLARYEYALALINRHPELYAGGLLVASNYLKLAVRFKGVDDGLAQSIASISKKWAELLNQLNDSVKLK